VSNRPGIEKQIKLAVEIVKSGGIVAFPTDTVYGLGADPCNERAVEKIFRVKRRSQKVPLPLLLSEKHDLTRVASVVPEIAWRLVEHFIPGGLTLVLKKSSWVPATVTAGGDTVAVRVPDHYIPLALIKGLGTPVIGTSANLSGAPNPISAEDVYRQLGEEVDFIVDGGKCPGGVESTVIDVSGAVPIIVREGAVSIKRIVETCGVFFKRPENNELHSKQ
jgi:L-threonylcarbamoyladenylate synthase